MCLFPVFNQSCRMAYTVLFSFILLAWTLSVGIGLSTPQEKCIISMSSHYSSVSQYCLSESTQKMVKPTVCENIFQLFDEICLFNISSTAFLLPEPHNVSKDNCVLLCADLDMLYVSRMVDNRSRSCTTLCTMDPEAVAVLLAMSHLKDFIAELKDKQSVGTVTDSTLVLLQQSNSSSEAVVNVSAPLEPNEKSTYAAARENDSTPKEEDITLKPVITVATEKNPTSDVKPTTTVTKERTVSPTKPDLITTTTVTKERMVSPTKPDVNTVTTAAARPSSSKSTKKSTTTADATEKKPAPEVKPTTTAAGENESTPKEADRTLKPVITDATEKKSAPDVKETTTADGENALPPNEAVATEKKPVPDVKPTTTVATEKKPAPDVKPTTTDATEKKPAPDGKPTITEHQAVLETTDISDDLNNDNQIPSGPEDKLGNTDETSRLDDTPSSYHFLIYFLAFIVLCVAAYIVFHNKHKIIAFIIEGKQGRRGGRPSTKQYTPLKSKVEDVMPFIEKSTTQSNYIY